MAKGNHSHFHDNMRNVHVRSRGLIFVALAITGFGAFSYWGLSTQNNDLLVKIEQLEDNIKIASSKQLELEEKLQLMAKKHSDQLTANAKLQSDLLQKENVISAQGEESSQWRDKVRAAESEVARFKTLIDDKEKEISNLKERIKTYIQDVSSKDNKLNEAQELIKTLQTKLGSLNSASVTNQPSNVPNQTSTRIPPAGAESKNVIPKPDNNKNEEEEVKADKSPANQEPVGARPDEKAAIVQADEEMELVDPKGNVMDQPEADNDEGKFKEIREEMEMADAEKNNANEPSKEEQNNAINEPSLLNSQDDNIDDEPALAANNNAQNFIPRAMIDQRREDNNQPEDQELENEHDDDRVEK